MVVQGFRLLIFDTGDGPHPAIELHIGDPRCANTVHIRYNDKAVHRLSPGLRLSQSSHKLCTGYTSGDENGPWYYWLCFCPRDRKRTRIGIVSSYFSERIRTTY